MPTFEEMSKQIALTQHLGLIRDEESRLSMPVGEQLLNHVGTVHAGAQYCLGELASGTYVEKVFPDLQEGTLIVLRRANVKYWAAAQGNLTAFTRIDDERAAVFRDQLQRRGGAIIDVGVELRGPSGERTFSGTFAWFIQSNNPLKIPAS